MEHKKIPMSAALMSRQTLGAYFGLYLIGLRKPILRDSKGYSRNIQVKLQVENQSYWNTLILFGLILPISYNKL